jgi:RNA-directed DNA polymerase
MRKQVAAGLADAMLAGPPMPSSVIARCAEVLGSGPPWLGPLARSMLRQFGGAWPWGSRRSLVEAILRSDLEDFFLHIRAARVRALFRSLGYPDAAADGLTTLCTASVPAALLDERQVFRLDRAKAQRYHSPHLPQGAPTSPALANLCAFRLDVRLQAAAEASGAHYTRYADDLVFSGGRDFARGAERFVALAGSIVLEEGYAVNFRKTQVMRRSVRQQVGGVVVNETPNVGRDEYDRIKAILHNCRKHGPATQTELPLAAFRRKLAGHVARIADIHPGRGERLKAVLEAIRWEDET